MCVVELLTNEFQQGFPGAIVPVRDIVFGLFDCVLSQLLEAVVLVYAVELPYEGLSAVGVSVRYELPYSPTLAETAFENCWSRSPCSTHLVQRADVTLRHLQLAVVDQVLHVVGQLSKESWP